MKFAFIKERINTQNRTDIFSPKNLASLQNRYPNLVLKVESSNTSVFTDADYQKVGIEVVEDITDCVTFFGVNELTIQTLVENKSYFLFSTSLKETLQNKSLLREVMLNKIDFYGIQIANNEFIGLNENKGIIGTYNAIRAFGIKFELFKLPKVESLLNKEALIAHLKRLVLPPLKIVITGNGEISAGVIEVLAAIKIKKVTINDYLNKNYTQSVYTQIAIFDYNKRRDEKVLDLNDFCENPQDYISDFERLTKVSDIFINTDFCVKDAPKILTREMLQAFNCKIKVVANLSSDVNNSIACVLKESTVEEPFYGYLPIENREVDLFHPASIVVVAVTHMPFDLTKNESENFTAKILENSILAFSNEDKDGILQNSSIIKNGKLTPKFSYLQDFVDVE